MQVILLENISKLGKIGDLVKVKNGFARNYLLKKNKALRANKENIELTNFIYFFFYYNFRRSNFSF